MQSLKVNDNLSESDYSIITKDNKFIQMEYIEEDVRRAEPYIVKPGVWAIKKTSSGLVLLETSFNNDNILRTHSFTELISSKIRTFFSNFDKYKSRGMLPVRNMLLWGPAGTGKTSTLIEAIDLYTKDANTAVIVWHTDKYEAHTVKDFFQTFQYQGVDRQIVVVEDIGGVESDVGRVRSDSSLLSILDNKEATFVIPTLLIATTNHPETLLGNISNRPGRFQDKIHVGFPKPNERLNLLKFFYNKEISPELEALIKGRDTEEFTPDHIKNVVINADLYDQSVEQAIGVMKKEIDSYKKAFGQEREMGVNSFYDE